MCVSVCIVLAGAGRWATEAAERASKAADRWGSVRSQDVWDEPVGLVQPWQRQRWQNQPGWRWAVCSKHTQTHTHTSHSEAQFTQKTSVAFKVSVQVVQTGSQWLENTVDLIDFHHNMQFVSFCLFCVFLYSSTSTQFSSVVKHSSRFHFKSETIVTKMLVYVYTSMFVMWNTSSLVYCFCFFPFSKDSDTRDPVGMSKRVLFHCLFFSVNLCETICFVVQSSHEPIKPPRLTPLLGNAIVVSRYVDAFSVTQPTNTALFDWMRCIVC